MEAITKTGKRIHGVIAAILVKKGAATPFDSNDPNNIVKKVVKKKAIKKVTKKAKKVK